MGQLWITPSKKPPLTTMIIKAWLGMSEKLPDMRLNKEFKPAIDHLHAYAEASLADNGIEQLGPAELCLRRGPEAFRKLTEGPNPLFREDQISPRKILFYAVQLAGTPKVDKYMDSGNEHDGPGAILRKLPTPQLQAEWGDNMGALQRVAIIAREQKNNRHVHDWALQEAHKINEALLEFAEEHKLVGYLRLISVRPPKRSKAQWSELFDKLKASRGGDVALAGANPKAETVGEIARRLKRLGSAAEAAGGRLTRVMESEGGGPGENFTDLIRRAGDQELREAFTLIGAKLGLAPAAAITASPEAALAAVVAGPAVAAVPVKASPAARVPARIMPARRKPVPKAKVPKAG